MSRLRDIAIQVINGIVPLSSEELAEERMKVCDVCPHLKKMLTQCELCSCFLELKTKVLSARCPIEKW